MAKLLITTQVYENYGTADEPYWKAKGGSDYVVKKFRGGEAAATEAVMGLRSQIECDNEGYREHILGWTIVGDKHLTEFEQSQLDYEGSIRYPSKELAW
jgi:hypothetical protein